MKLLRTFLGADGGKFEVPEPDVDKFRSEVPDAVEMHEFFGDDGSKFRVPATDLDTFRSEVPGARPRRKAKTRDGRVVDGPELEVAAAEEFDTLSRELNKERGKWRIMRGNQKRRRAKLETELDAHLRTFAPELGIPEQWARPDDPDAPLPEGAPRMPPGLSMRDRQQWMEDRDYERMTAPRVRLAPDGRTVLDAATGEPVVSAAGGVAEAAPNRHIRGVQWQDEAGVWRDGTGKAISPYDIDEADGRARDTALGFKLWMRGEEPGGPPVIPGVSEAEIRASRDKLTGIGRAQRDAHLADTLDEETARNIARLRAGRGIGAGEQFKRVVLNAGDYIPFSPLPLAKALVINDIMKRDQAWAAWDEGGREGPEPPRITALEEARANEFLSDKQLQEELGRSMTAGTVEGVAHLVPHMAEMAMGGGLVGAVQKGIVKGVTSRAAGKAAARAVGKWAAKSRARRAVAWGGKTAAALAVDATVRTGLNPMGFGADYLERRQMPGAVSESSEPGQLFERTYFPEEQRGRADAFMNTLGDRWVEYFSEGVGDRLTLGLGKALPGTTRVGRYVRRLGTRPVARYLKQAGFAGGPLEFLEERVGGGMREALGVDLTEEQKSAPLGERMARGLVPGEEEGLIEAAVLMVPMLGAGAVNTMMKRGKLAELRKFRDAERAERAAMNAALAAAGVDAGEFAARSWRTAHGGRSVQATAADVQQIEALAVATLRKYGEPAGVRPEDVSGEDRQLLAGLVRARRTALDALDMYAVRAAEAGTDETRADAQGSRGDATGRADVAPAAEPWVTMDASGDLVDAEPGTEGAVPISEVIAEFEAPGSIEGTESSLVLDDGRAFAPDEIVPPGSYPIGGQTVSTAAPMPARDLMAGLRPETPADRSSRLLAAGADTAAVDQVLATGSTDAVRAAAPGAGITVGSGQAAVGSGEEASATPEGAAAGGALVPPPGRGGQEAGADEARALSMRRNYAAQVARLAAMTQQQRLAEMKKTARGDVMSEEKFLVAMARGGGVSPNSVAKSLVRLGLDRGSAARLVEREYGPGSVTAFRPPSRSKRLFKVLFEDPTLSAVQKLGGFKASEKDEWHGLPEELINRSGGGMTLEEYLHNQRDDLDVRQGVDNARQEADEQDAGDFVERLRRLVDGELAQRRDEEEHYSEIGEWEAGEGSELVPLASIRTGAVWSERGQAWEATGESDTAIEARPITADGLGDPVYIAYEDHPNGIRIDEGSLHAPEATASVPDTAAVPKAGTDEAVPKAGTHAEAAPEAAAVPAVETSRQDAKSPSKKALEPAKRGKSPDKRGRTLRHFTTPERAERLRTDGVFSFDNAPIHGTGSLDDGPKTGRFAGRRIYLSLDDEGWGAKAEFTPSGDARPVDMQNPERDMDAVERGEAESFYDYARQQWMLRPGRRDRKQLEGVDVQIDDAARVLVIDSPERLAIASQKYGALLDNDAAWDNLARDYDVVEIRNTQKHAGASKFFRAAMYDQAVVLNAAVAHVAGKQAPPAAKKRALVPPKRKAKAKPPAADLLSQAPAADAKETKHPGMQRVAMTTPGDFITVMKRFFDIRRQAVGMPSGDAPGGRRVVRGDDAWMEYSGKAGRVIWDSPAVYVQSEHMETWNRAAAVEGLPELAGKIEAATPDVAKATPDVASPSPASPAGSAAAAKMSPEQRARLEAIKRKLQGHIADGTLREETEPYYAGRRIVPPARSVVREGGRISGEALQVGLDLASLYAETGLTRYEDFAGAVRRDLPPDMWETLKAHLPAFWNHAGAENDSLEEITRKEAAAVHARIEALGAGGADGAGAGGAVPGPAAEAPGGIDLQSGRGSTTIKDGTEGSDDARPNRDTQDAAAAPATGDGAAGAPGQNVGDRRPDGGDLFGIRGQSGDASASASGSGRDGAGLRGGAGAAAGRGGQPGEPGHDGGVGAGGAQAGGGVGPGGVRVDGGGGGLGAGAVHPGVPAGVRGRPQGGEAAGAGVRAGDGAAGAAAHLAGENWRLSRADLAEGGVTARAEANMAALRLLKRIEREGRAATPDEQRTLAAYAGWGHTGMKNAMFPVGGSRARGTLGNLADELKTLLTPEEYATAARSTQYAHYTTPEVIASMWRAAQRLGFRGGRVWEGGFGIGRFQGLIPEDLAGRTVMSGVEMDHVSAAIARLLYPKADLRQGDFVDFPLLSDTFDLAIGNPPFSDRTVTADRQFARHKLLLHDYFIAKQVVMLKPGGIAILVTSHGTMDKGSQKARELIASQADLIGAVRLPNTAFKTDAGTEVVTDILFLRKRDLLAGPGGEAWMELAEIRTADGGKAWVNEYFARHPEMVLGRHALSGKMRFGGGQEYTVEGAAGDIEALIDAAVARLPAAAPEAAPAPDGAMAPILTGADNKPAALADSKLEGGVVLDGRALFKIMKGRRVPILPMSERRHRGDGPVYVSKDGLGVLRDYVPLRDAYREVLRLQREGNDADLAAAQKELRRLHDVFTYRHGPLNRSVSAGMKTDVDSGEEIEILRYPNRQVIKHDAWWGGVSAMERVDDAGRVIELSALTRERVIGVEAEPRIETPADALAAVLRETPRPDIARVAELLGIGEDEAVGRLGDLVYRDPESGGWQTRQQYLSGNVREKLARAREAARGDPSLARNVEALERVVPADKPVSRISLAINMPIVPESDIEQFMAEHVGHPVRVQRLEGTGRWRVADDHLAGRRHRARYSTARRTSAEILEAVLKNQPVTVYDTINGKPVHNADASAAANEACAQMRAAWGSWVWADAERMRRLARAYNDTYNNFNQERYDGSHLTFPGLSLKITPYPHQRDLAWRFLSNGNTYAVHEVGLGKTLAAALAVMEARRMGQARKPMISVPNHMLGQWNSDFLEAYPGARLLVADEENFSPQRRQEFMGLIANSDYDAVIITHSAFKLMGMAHASEAAFLKEELAKYDRVLDALPKSDRRGRRDIEAMREKMRDKLAALANMKRDKGLVWDDLGVDMLVVDEAHEYRKLSFATTRTRTKGIDPQGSQAAWDLYMKLRGIHARTPGRNILFLSGTPVVNTMAEVYSVQRMLQPQALAAAGLEAFDDWANSFAGDKITFEKTAGKGFQTALRLGRWVNLSGLSGMWNQIADYKRSDDLPYMKGKRPRLRTGGFQAVVVDESAAQKDYRERVIMERIEAIKNRQGPPQKGDDILLTVITDAKHVAMDERFADSTLSGSGGKLDRMAAKILEIHAEGSRGADPDLRTQIVFMDLGLPDMLDKRGFSAYLALREALVEGGIPAREIAFAQDYKTKDAKSALQEAVRAGRVRVLIGSMAGMGTGWNVQERLAAAHFLTIPWYPALVEQAVGRIVRQGNVFASVSVPADAESWAQDAFYPGLLEEAYDRLVGEVDVFCYMTKGTIEEFLWHMNENKSRWIEGFYRGGVDEFDGELDSESDQYAVLRQMTSDDPRVLRLAEMQGEMARLQGLERAHLDDMAAIASEVEKREAFRKSDEDALAKWENIPEPPSTRKDAFLAEIGGKTFEKRPEALKALLAQTARAVESGQDTLAVAFGGGFEVWAERDTLVPGHAVMIFKHRGTPLRISPINVAMADDSQRAGLLQKIENAINGIPERLSSLRRQIQESRELTERLKARITPFERGPEIEEMRRRIRALQDEMTASSQAVPGRGAAPAAGGGVAEAAAEYGQAEDASADDDFIEMYREAHDEAIGDFVREFRSSAKGQVASWPVVPAGRLKKIWTDHARMGFVRDEAGMDGIARKMIGLVARLDAATEILGHTQIDAREELLEPMGYEFTDEEWGRFQDFLTAPSGQWRLSDYGMKPLQGLARELAAAKSAEEQLVIVDRMLNVTHQRGDMAENFVEGGKKTLDWLANQGGSLQESPAAYGDGRADDAAARFDGELQRQIDVPANPWPENFGKVMLMSSGPRVRNHRDHAAAKAGDVAAAVRLVDELGKPAKLRAFAAAHPGAIVLAVHGEEEAGRNALPETYARYIGVMTGLEVDGEIVMANRVGHTGAGHWHRLAVRPTFNGRVQAGREYLLVDDLVRDGGTLSELRWYIEARGGRVVGVSTLGHAIFADTIALSDKTRVALEQRYGLQSLRDFLKEQGLYGGEHRALAEGEGRTLLSAGSLDAARDRLAEARQAAGVGGGGSVAGQAASRASQEEGLGDGQEQTLQDAGAARADQADGLGALPSGGTAGGQGPSGAADAPGGLPGESGAGSVYPQTAIGSSLAAWRLPDGRGVGPGASAVPAALRSKAEASVRAHYPEGSPEADSAVRETLGQMELAFGAPDTPYAEPAPAPRSLVPEAQRLRRARRERETALRGQERVWEARKEQMRRALTDWSPDALSELLGDNPDAGVSFLGPHGSRERMHLVKGGGEDALWDEGSVLVLDAGADVVIRSPRDVARLMLPLRSPEFESFKVIALDAAGRVLGARVVSTGLLDSCPANARATMGWIPDGTAGVVVAHNHPSGDPSPSPDDLQVSQILVRLGEIIGVPVLDHVITNGSYVSQRGGGQVKFDGADPYGGAGDSTGRITDRLADWEVVAHDKRPQFTRAPHVVAAFNPLRRAALAHGGQIVHVLLVDSKSRLVAVERIDAAGLSPDQFAARIAGAGLRHRAAGRVFLDFSFADVRVARLNRAAESAVKAAGMELLDSFDSLYQSKREMGRQGGWGEVVAGPAQTAAEGAVAEDVVPYDYDARQRYEPTPPERLTDAQLSGHAAIEYRRSAAAWRARSGQAASLVSTFIPGPVRVELSGEQARAVARAGEMFDALARRSNRFAEDLIPHFDTTPPGTPRPGEVVRRTFRPSTEPMYNVRFLEFLDRVDPALSETLAARAFDEPLPQRPGSLAMARDSLDPDDIASTLRGRVNVYEGGVEARGASATEDRAHYGGRRLVPPPRSEVREFAGVLARNAPDASRAEAMEEGGADREAVWRETGFWRGLDGKWRYELDTSRRMLKPGALARVEEAPQPLAAVIDHPELFAAYPHMRSIDVELRVAPGPPQAQYDDWSGRIKLSGPRDGDWGRVLAHEVQHAIQEREVFERGGDMTAGSIIEPLVEERRRLNRELADLAKAGRYDSAEYRAKAARRDAIISQEWEIENPDNARGAYDAYRRLAGEAEARLAERRLGMTPAERAAEPPWETLEKMLRGEGLLKDGQRIEDVLIRPRTSVAEESAQYGGGGDATALVDAIPDEKFEEIAGVSKNTFFASGGRVEYGDTEGHNGYYDAKTGTIVINPDMPPERRRAALRHELSHWAQAAEGTLPSSTFVSPEESIRGFMDYLTDPAELRAQAAADGMSRDDIDRMIAEIEEAKTGVLEGSIKNVVVSAHRVVEVERVVPTMKFLKRRAPELAQRLASTTAVAIRGDDLGGLNAELARAEHDELARADYGEDSSVSESATHARYEFQMARLGIGDRLRPGESGTIKIKKLHVSLRSTNGGSVNPITIARELNASGFRGVDADGPRDVAIPLDEHNLTLMGSLAGRTGMPRGRIALHEEPAPYSVRESGVPYGSGSVPPAADGAPDWDAFADLAQRAADFERLAGRRVEITRAIERHRMTRLAREMQRLKRASARAQADKAAGKAAGLDAARKTYETIAGRRADDDATVGDLMREALAIGRRRGRESRTALDLTRMLREALNARVKRLMGSQLAVPKDWRAINAAVNRRMLAQLDQIETSIQASAPNQRASAAAAELRRLFGLDKAQWTALENETRMDALGPATLLQAARKAIERDLRAYYRAEMTTLFGGRTVERRLPSGQTITVQSQGLARRGLRRMVPEQRQAMETLIEGIDFANLKDLPLDAMRAHVDRAREILAEDALAKKAIAEGHKIRREEAAEAAAAEVKAARPALAQAAMGDPEKGDMLQRLGWFTASQNRRALLLAGGNESGAIGTVLWSNLLDANERQLTLEGGDLRAFDAKIAELGFTRRDMLDLSYQLREVELADGRKILMTRGEMMTLYGMTLDEDARLKLVANGWIPARWRKGKGEDVEIIRGQGEDYDARLAASEAIIGGVVAQLTPAEKAFVEWMVADQSREWARRGNETSRRMTGAELFEDKPHITLAGSIDREAVVPDVDHDDFARGTHMVDNMGLTKERQAHSHALFVRDIFSIYRQQARDMSVYTAWSIPFRDAMTLLSRGPALSAIVNRWGKDAVRTMKETLAYVTYQKGHTDNWTATQKWFYRRERAAAGFILGMQASSAMLNRYAGALAMAAAIESEGIAVAGARARFLARVFRPQAGMARLGVRERRAAYDALMADGYLYDRWHRSPYRVFAQLASARMEREEAGRVLRESRSLARRDWWQRFQQKALSFMTAGEIGNGVDLYLTLRSGGMSQADAVRTVSRLTRLTQNPSTPLDETTQYTSIRSGGLGFMMPFTGQPAVLWNYVKAEHIKARRSGNWGPFRAALTGAVSATLFSVALRMVLRRASKGLMDGDDDDEKELNRETANTILDLAGEFSGAVMPGGDQLAQAFLRPAIAYALNDRSLASVPPGDSTLLSRVMESGYRMWKVPWRVARGEAWTEEQVEKLFIDAHRLIGMTTGLPTGGIEQAARVGLGLAGDPLGREPPEDPGPVRRRRLVPPARRRR